MTIFLISFISLIYDVESLSIDFFTSIIDVFNSFSIFFIASISFLSFVRKSSITLFKSSNDVFIAITSAMCKSDISLIELFIEGIILFVIVLISEEGEIKAVLISSDNLSLIELISFLLDNNKL